VKTIRLLAILSLSLCLLASLAQAQDLQKQLVGKWQGNENSFMQFFPDGKITVTDKIFDKDLKLEGTYKILDAETVHIEIKDQENKITVKAKVTIKGDDLSFTPEGDKTEHYKRVP